MCGIVAVITRDPSLAQTQAPAVTTILDRMAYRGPDAQGLWAFPHVLLGHRRLSIIDLSEAGTQPMHAVDHGLHITFNGEIYNYRDLRKELESQGYRFRTETDTEVILGAYTIYGKDFLTRLRGMFAFVLYDEKKKRVLLCRDRMGKKPLYYYADNHRLFAASELKFLYAFKEITLTMDAESLQAYFCLQYVPGPGTILREVKKVAPGECIELDIPSWQTTANHYWSIRELLGARQASPVKIGEIDAALRESVRYRLIADVKIGILLSGGIDSSLLACYAAEESNTALKAFLVSFEQQALDESRFAKMVAQSLGIELIEINGGKLDQDTFMRAIFHADEPLGDPACIPTFMIAEVIAQQVKVVLSGEGADELFWGYDYYRKQLLFDTIRAVCPDLRPSGSMIKLLASIENNPRAGGFLSRLSKILSTPGETGCARWTSIFGHAALANLMSGVHDQHEVNARQMQAFENSFTSLKQQAGCSAASLALDLLYWLPDDLLAKVDRMSMAHSIEARAPYLDHHLVQLALRMPAGQKADFFTGKKVLRSLLLQKMSPETARIIAGRTKHGFDVPLVHWLENELRDHAEDCFSQSRIGATGFLNYSYTCTLWNNFRKTGGTVPFARKVWLLLCFMTWYENHNNRFGFR